MGEGVGLSEHGGDRVSSYETRGIIDTCHGLFRAGGDGCWENGRFLSIVVFEVGGYEWDRTNMISLVGTLVYNAIY